MPRMGRVKLARWSLTASVFSMDFKHILITGGAGFVGSNLALLLKRSFANVRVTALDNLKRRGGELNLPRLAASDVGFVHGDVRSPEDLDDAGGFDRLIDCSAEPAVTAGTTGSPMYVLNTNLGGTINCLEAARARGAAVLFLSTSRVYPIGAVNALRYHEDETRFVWDGDDEVPGFSTRGIGEDFPLDGARSFYGASKLACELVLREYVHSYGLRALVNRCGVIAGPWQMGRVEQGVVTLWVACHEFGKPLRYIGFGGQGKQVRDLLHVEDLFDLLVLQMHRPSDWDGRAYNVGGGPQISVSLRELTGLCESATGKSISIDPEPRTSDVDVRLYVTDTANAQRDFTWRPQRSVEQIVTDTCQWVRAHRDRLEPILG